MKNGEESVRYVTSPFARLWGWCSLLTIGLAVVCLAPVEQAGAVESEIREDLQSGHRVRVVCFGDSVTGVYYHTGGRRAYTDMLGIALRRTFPTAKVEMINAGISGNTTVDGLVRIDRDVLGHRPDLVTVMFGLNDMTRVPLETYRANLQTIVRKCRGVGASVVLATPNCVVSTPARPTEKLLAYCDVVRQVARDLKVSLSDCYQATDVVRDRDAMQWRLLMSDAIHPNMEGHKLLAEQLNETITGRQVALADVPPPQPAIPRTLSLLRAGKPVRVLAMSPSDTLIRAALRKLDPHAEVNVHPWAVADLSLDEIEQDAKQRVRALKPDLVVIAVPRQAPADSEEAFIRAYSWIMNWSLSFSLQQWDCVVLHPSVLEPVDQAADRDELVRRLVRAQDLTLIDRSHGSTEDAETILQHGLRQ